MRRSSPYPWRKVVKSETSIAWWEHLGRRLTSKRYLTLACGHTVVRVSVKAPKRVRCDGCMPEN